MNNINLRISVSFLFLKMGINYKWFFDIEKCKTIITFLLDELELSFSYNDDKNFEFEKDLKFEINSSNITFERKLDRKSIDMVSMLSNDWIQISNFSGSFLSKDEFMNIITEKIKEPVKKNLKEFTCTKINIDDIQNLGSVIIDPNDYSASAFTKKGHRLYGETIKYHN